MRSLLFFSFIIIAFAGCTSAIYVNTDSGVPNTASAIREVSPAEAQTAVSKAYSQFVDVRTPEEYASGHAARAVNIPLDTLMSNLDRLEKSEPVYLICQSGASSRQAASMLKDAGFNNVINVAGGTAAWKTAGLPIETKPPHNVPETKP